MPDFRGLFDLLGERNFLINALGIFYVAEFGSPTKVLTTPRIE